ncbi:MAG TPA: phasin family protein [Candidatus Contendobacter sp.]|nr:phasin family protein [Candidatus Contendobacter sp.]HRZ23856.1 phasin family protein [Candidatus Contendobacter sp.]HRZ53044.1 phasin family protein [Candidatus Contendobacter sp.]
MSHDTEKQAPESVADQIRAVVDKAQEKAGEVVDSLVKEGEKLRDQTRKLAEEKVGEVKERVEEVREMVEGAKTKAVDTLDNLEQLFEERVARALKRLGVPTRDDLQSIAKRLEAMNDLIQGLAQEGEGAEEAAPGAEKDDLKLISGIGPVLEGKLNGAGITSYQQIAALSDDEIERLESDVINFSGRIQRDDWIGQAKTLYLKKYGKTI